jgi:hypothetical protein
LTTTNLSRVRATVTDSGAFSIKTGILATTALALVTGVVGLM